MHVSLGKTLQAANGQLDLRVQFTLKEGEFVTIFGSSGEGKTSILRMIAGLLVPDSGHIQMNDQMWFEHQGFCLPPQQRSIGFVFQQYALFPHMTVYENLLYALQDKEQEFIDYLLEFSQLTNLRNQRPHMLSGGQQQRVALLRALVRKPKLLLLDEPFSALDNEMRLQLQEELLRIHKEFATTTILVSHNLGDVFRLADRIFMLENGQITKQGTPQEVFIKSKVSSKFRFVGEVVNIQPEDIAYVVTVLVGNNAVNIVATTQDVEGLAIGQRVMICSKAFNPMIWKI